MPTFLIVNDDGARSPMLRPMAEKLAALGSVTVAVPMEEQSWKGKAMTRFDPVRAEPRPELWHQAFALSGTPADCANIAVHHLLPNPPDYIVSGINIGSNAGSGFIVNSGTVGAALEGALQGLPAVAFSAVFAPEDFAQWSREMAITGEGALNLIEQATTRMVAMMEVIVAQGNAGKGIPEGHVLNINFPSQTHPDTPVRWAPVKRNRYASLFGFKDGAYHHGHNVTLADGPADGSDRDVLANEEISVSLLSVDGWGVSTPPIFPL